MYTLYIYIYTSMSGFYNSLARLGLQKKKKKETAKISKHCEVDHVHTNLLKSIFLLFFNIGDFKIKTLSWF